MKKLGLSVCYSKQPSNEKSSDIVITSIEKTVKDKRKERKKSKKRKFLFNA